MPTLTLPRLVAGRELAATAVERLGPIDGTDVMIDARPLVSGTASFAAELVRSAIVIGHAARVIVAGGPPDFRAELRAAAQQLAVADRVILASEVPAAS